MKKCFVSAVRGGGLLVCALLFLAYPFPSHGKEVKKLSENEAQGAARPEYVIGLGDQLRIMVWKEPDLSQDMTVRIDGRVSLPLLGDVLAAGRTIKQLTRDLEKGYAEVIAEPAVSVMLLQSKSWRYYIIGKVAQPGEFPIDYPITVLQAIARSGGFQEWAKQDQISIVRPRAGGEQLLSFDYDTFVSGEDLRQNIFIQPGDTIIIP